MLKHVFDDLVHKYTDTSSAAEAMWAALEAAYAEPVRRYHTLSHLEDVLRALDPVQSLLKDRSAVLFALFYHDAVYDPASATNEEDSAELAQERMHVLGVPGKTMAHCRRMILATKGHAATGDTDTDLFTDADLAILGADPERYADYAHAIREEYAVYPDAVYLPGRKKVLEHFLGMEQIYKTPYFYGRLEEAARVNLRRELSGQ
ncbi:MAG: hypothetical protein EOO16_18410 [Chitinophagaceae bacterium]|nr:MAG: hypothetical protein EOO16_18410 [Chitinophagaceae bacterium]